MKLIPRSPADFLPARLPRPTRPVPTFRQNLAELGRQSLGPVAAHVLILLGSASLDAVLAIQCSVNMARCKTSCLEWVMNLSIAEMSFGLLLALVAWYSYGKRSNTAFATGVAVAVGGALLAVNAYWIVSLFFK